MDKDYKLFFSYILVLFMVITAVVAVFTRSRDSAFGTVNGVRGGLVTGRRLFQLKRTDLYSMGIVGNSLGGKSAVTRA